MSPSTYRGTRSFSVLEPLICKILGRGVIFRGTQKTTLWHNLLVLDMNWKNYLSATKPLVEAQRGPTGNQNLGSCQAYIPRIIYFSGFKIHLLRTLNSPDWVISDPHGYTGTWCKLNVHNWKSTRWTNCFKYYIIQRKHAPKGKGNLVPGDSPMQMLKTPESLDAKSWICGSLIYDTHKC